MDDATPEVELPSFATEVAKAFAINLAASAGLFGGLLVLGSAMSWAANRKKRKAESTDNE